MKKLFIIPIVVGAALLTVGSVILAVGLTQAAKEESKTNEYVLEQDFHNFDIDLSTSDFEIKLLEGTNKKVVVKETEKQYHEVKIENDTLVVKQVDTRKWHERLFSFNFGINITIYLPEANYSSFKMESSTGHVYIPHSCSFDDFDLKLSTGDVEIDCNVTNSMKIEASTGDMTLSNLDAKSVNLKASTGNVTLNKVNASEDITVDVSTGKVNMTDVKSKDMNVSTSTGRVVLNDVIVSNHIEIETGTGDVKLNDCDADTLKIKTDTGDVIGTLLTNKVFYVKTDTGKVEVPQSTTGGLCEIETDTGDIKLQIKA